MTNPLDPINRPPGAHEEAHAEAPAMPTIIEKQITENKKQVWIHGGPPMGQRLSQEVVDSLDPRVLAGSVGERMKAAAAAGEFDEATVRVTAAALPWWWKARMWLRRKRHRCQLCATPLPRHADGSWPNRRLCGGCAQRAVHGR